MAILSIDEHDAPLRKALKVMGSRAKLGAALGISKQTISQWKRVPAERVMQVEEVTKIPRSVLRPDLYPKDRERK